MCLGFEDVGEILGEEIGRRQDVRAALAFKEDGEPEGSVGSLGRDEGACRTLDTDQSSGLRLAPVVRSVVRTSCIMEEIVGGFWTYAQ